MPIAKPTKEPSTWRIILAAFLDFITAFALSGIVVAALTGGFTDNGFRLNGAPALAAIALIIAYFIILNKFLGGTIWKWILRARRP